MRNSGVVRLLGLALFLIVGCYPYERHVRLSYATPAGAGARFDGHGSPIVVTNFLDQRPDRKVIGRISSAAVVTAEPVTADNDPGQWVADAIRTELAHGNYAILPDGQPAPQGVFTIDGTLIKAFSTASGNYTADVVFEARISKDGHPVFSRRYSGHGDKGAMVAGSPELMADALSDALGHAVDQFLTDFQQATAK